MTTSVTTAPGISTDHHVILYSGDNVLIESLATYVSEGFDAGETVVIIATQAHLYALNAALAAKQYNLEALIRDRQYIAMDAAATLKTFMQDNWPAKDLFFHALSPILEKAGAGNRKIRAFGEMVMLLWRNRLHGATIQLEQLWNDLSQQFNFTLLCAYPVTAFEHGLQSALKHVCKAHATTTLLPADIFMD
ncbi:MAG: MEDS domain-containing protein [Chitinophagaceae bacterium]